MYANSTLRGSGMNATELVRDAAATGTAIREKTTGEGNGSSGATGIWLKDFKLTGNASGDGINLGNAGSAQLNINAGLENVFVNAFTAGYGMILNGNATYARQIWSNNNQYGIKFAGGGSNKWYSVRAEGNTSNNILVQDGNNQFFGVHCEENANAGASGTIEVSSNNNTFFGVTISLFFNRSQLIVLKSGSARMTVYWAQCSKGSSTYSNLIYDEAYAKGSGAPTSGVVPLWLDNGADSSYIFDSSTGNKTTITGALLPFQSSANGNHPSTGSSITIDAGWKFRVNGTGTINTVNFSAADDGRTIVFVCDATPTFADGTGNLYLNGDFVGNINSTLTLVGDASLNGWVEMCRSANS